jgi:hypothetical protein
MSTQLNTDPNVIELTQAELDSVTGGQTSPPTQMAQLEMIKKMNEALTKMFKAAGDAVKGLT